MTDRHPETAPEAADGFELFHRQARATPDAVAVDDGRESLSYDQLAARALELAAALRRFGLEDEEIVGISMERSTELVVAVLGVLAAGGAYLPLDPAYPAGRRRYMVEDSGCRRVLAGPGLGTDLGGVEVLQISDLLEATSSSPATRTEERAVLDPQRLAYVIYTSGSTGRPKGVLVPHRGLAGVVAAQLRSFACGPGGRVLQFSSWSFDASVAELLMALGSGACLCLARQEELLPGPDLVDLLVARRITHATLPPSVLAAVPPAELPELGCLCCAGENLPGPLAERWGRGRRLFNLYGPTETTIWATAHRVEAGEDRPAIGIPVAGTTVTLAGPRGEAVAPGEVGEILLGGPGVARGYLGRPRLTAERFLPDPTASDLGARRYRTGDLARRREDGSLEFRGRRDHQVKVRGLRIELGEVEAVLAAHPDVEAAAAGVATSGSPRLLAWVVLTPGSSVTARQLREHLAGELPRHMVPDEVVPIDALPLTANGKLDRSALPVPETESHTGGRAPEGPVESALAQLWCRLLGVDQVFADDDFFALGGHSLLVGQLISRVRRELGASLDLGEVFEASSLATMATKIASKRTLGGGDAAHDTLPEPPPIHRQGRHHAVPLSFPQERVWFLDRLVRGNIAYNAQATVEFEGPLRHDVLERVFEEIVRRHEIFRTTFREHEGRAVQDVHPPAPLVLPLIDLERIPEDQRHDLAEALVRRELGRPFRLGALPLARWTLVRFAPRHHLLIQVEHHFVHDGWAFAVLMGEVKTLYDAFARGLPSPLADPAVQYTDFALWQREWLDGEVLRRHLDVWSRRLEGLPPALELPTDHPRPKVQSFRGRGPRIVLDGELADRLRAFAQRQGTTLFAVMTAGFYALLERYTGATDIALGSAMANRPLPELEAMPGMVVNTLVLRADLAGRPSFAEVVDRVRRGALEAWAYQSVPLEKLVAEIAPDRDLSRNPLFQVMFSFHDSPVPDLELDLPAGELRGTVLERHNGSAKNDLNVVVIPRAEQRVGRAPRPSDREIVLIWEYSTDLFDEATIERMIGHYRALLADAVAHPKRRLAELTMLAPVEVARLEEWEGSPEGTDPAPFRAVHLDLVEGARKTPRGPALESEGRTLDHGELDRRSAALAADLRRRGVGSEVLVALLCPRSPELVVAALAVLRAGGAYLPLDPDAPAKRLASMVEASGARLLLAHPDLRKHLADRADAAVPVITIDLEAELGHEAPQTSGLDRPPHPDQLAYVIYTSGSTGTPKAVGVPHRGLANLVAWHRDTFGSRAGDRASLIANPAFDASVWETWSGLSGGGSLLIPGDGTRSDAGSLLAWLDERRASHCFLPTPMAEAVLDDLERRGAAAPQSLRILAAGGDRLHRYPPTGLGCELVNHYGPTECSVISVSTTVPSVTEARAPAIGRPIARTRALVLDGGLRRRPQGLPGELFLAGAGLARGYLGSPRLTAERFLPDPTSPIAGARLYRTGDLARWRPDGQLECLGRTDHQVKIRGFR
ncbi:MAG: amino acid adenylation domain-containing protein, partial [Acidobacteria bacterium]|nr:amino acid adenylation domain-containing protein [Acidobacteriota bacterium]